MAKLEFFNRFWTKKFVVFGIIIILLFIAGLSLVLNLPPTIKETPYKVYPAEGEYVHGEVIVAFRAGYIPKILNKEILEEKNKNIFEKLHAGIKNERAPEEKIKLIENEFNRIGITKYESQVEDNIEILNKFYILYYDPKIPIEEIQKHLGDFPFLESSEPNSILTVFNTPNDPYYSQLWGMQKIQAPQAWDITTGSNNIVVADIDTGVDLSHPDLSNNVISGRQFATCDITDDKTGVCTRQYNCPRSADGYCDDDPMDDAGHGTHVAGTIGGIGNNGIGVAGVNWNVKIMPVKVMGSDGQGNTPNIQEGIRYATDNGARIVNLSLGGTGACTSSYQSFVDYAISKGVVLVIAAGNSNRDAFNSRPANCNGVITVGATGPNDERANYSNYGSVVEIAAPGGDKSISGNVCATSSCILSTIPGGGYSYNYQGTSMATPHVAGAAALLLSVNPNLTPQQVAACLIDNADPISTDKPIGHRLNIFKAISACGGGSIPTLPPATPTVTSVPGSSPTPTITSAPGRYTISVHVYNDNNNSGREDSGDTSYQGATVDLTGLASSGGFTDISGNITFPNLLSGNYTVRVTAPSQPAQVWSDLLTSNMSLSAGFPKIPPITPPVIVTIPVLPTSAPLPTQTPIPTSSVPGSSPTPIPTPQTTYTCKEDPKCTAQQKNLQLCSLICFPQ
ncbi:MAG: S8 family serine peptidase [Patescibacteria group bacterium]